MPAQLVEVEMIAITYTFCCDHPGCETARNVERTLSTAIGLIVPLLPDGWTNRPMGPIEERQYCPLHSALRE